MQQHLRDFFVARVCAGFLRFTKGNLALRIYPPTDDVMYEATYEYNVAYQDALMQGIKTDDEMVLSLVDMGLWNDKMQEDFEKIPDRIEELKVGLLNYAFRPIECERVRKMLNNCKQEYARLHNIRHSYDYTTCEGAAGLVKWQYIIEHSTRYADGRPYEWDEISPMELLSYWQDNTLPDSVIRELAKTEPWGSLWSIKKKNGKIFEEPLSHEQRSLMMWSMTYDIVHESPDCPQDEIIEDDDMLDGWFIVQKRKRLKEKSKDYAEAMITNKKIAGADEIFVVAKSEREIESINSLNDVRGDIIRKQRLNQVKKQGEVPFVMLQDVQQRIRTEFTNKESQYHKDGKK
jgi:hypothetical protein